MWILQNKENFSSPVKEIIGANNFQAKLRSVSILSIYKLSYETRNFNDSMDIHPGMHHRRWEEAYETRLEEIILELCNLQNCKKSNECQNTCFYKYQIKPTKLFKKRITWVLSCYEKYCLVFNSKISYQNMQLFTR